MSQNLRLVKVSELDFLISVQKNLFGRNTDFIKQWKSGDRIAFVVGDKIAGLARVSGKCFRSETPVWLKELNPFRLPINFTHVFSEQNRPSFSKHKEELEKEYGKFWGNVFVLRKQLPAHVIKSIMESVETSQADYSLVEEIEVRIYQAIEAEKNNAIEQYHKIQEKCAEDDGKEEELTYEEKRQCLVHSLLRFIRSDPTRFEILNELSFVSTLSDEQKSYFKEVSFGDVKSDAHSAMVDMGLYRDLNPSYGPGTYVIVSDTHGDHTRNGMFCLLNSVIKFLNPKKVFHLGHIQDDNGVINPRLLGVKNLTVVTRIEECSKVEKFWKENGKEFEIVRDGVVLGGIIVVNQDVQTDYMSLRAASPAVRKAPYRETFIMAHHLHELDAAQCDDESRIISAYTGCLCEKHVESTVGNSKYTDSDSIERLLENPVWHSRTHRRKWAQKESWEQGLFVVHVRQDGKYTIISCRIKRVIINGREQYATSYFDKIICEDGVKAPDTKTFINADLHIPLVDPKILEIQNQIVSDYRPDIFVNLGDTRNSEGLSHHKMERNEIVTEPILREGAMVYHILKNMSKWAPEKYLLFGNHERFARDFVEMYPQFKGLVEFEFVSGYNRLGYKLIDHQEKLEIGDVVYVHGDMLRGRSTGPLDSFAGAFPHKTVVCGHYHYSAARKGCYAIAQTGLRDQQYNEGTITRWSHGFGLCNEISGVSFVTSLIIEDYSITINGKTYTATKEDFWKNFRYMIEINYIPDSRTTDAGSS